MNIGTWFFTSLLVAIVCCGVPHTSLAESDDLGATRALVDWNLKESSVEQGDIIRFEELGYYVDAVVIKIYPSLNKIMLQFPTATDTSLVKVAERRIVLTHRLQELMLQRDELLKQADAGHFAPDARRSMEDK